LLRIPSLWTVRIIVWCHRKRQTDYNNYILDVQRMRQQIPIVMDKKTARWVKIMTITRKLCGCHQKPERSFFMRGYQLPLCARCTGVLIGYIISMLLLFLEYSIPYLICVLFLVPLILDGGIQLLYNLMSNNIRRLITGVLFGTGLIQLIANFVNFIFQ